jgi:hypothetical protein
MAFKLFDIIFSGKSYYRYNWMENIVAIICLSENYKLHHSAF